MKMKKIWMILGAIIISLSMVRAQSLVITTSDGNEVSQSFDNLLSLSFPASYLLVKQTDGASNQIQSTDIRKIWFKDIPVKTDEKSKSTEAISVFPNPVNDILQVKNLNETNGVLKIYRIDGSLYYSKATTESESSIDVSNWRGGLYILKYNSRAVKFQKL
jgi:hypothetical protein